MGLVRNFHAAHPGERDDGRPYVAVEFWEAPDVSGAPGDPSLIDTQDLDPVDTDPSDPISRNLTTEEATLEIGWYRLVFVDEDGDEDRGDWTLFTGTEPSLLPGGLTLEAFKRELDFDEDIDVDDDLLTDKLLAALAQAQAPAPWGCGRVLIGEPLTDGEAAITRQLVTYGRWVRVPDAREITAVTVDGDTAVLDTDYYTLEHRDLIVQIEIAKDGTFDTWDPPRRKIAVTGRFGYLEIPQNLKQAIYVLGARWVAERQAQYADQVSLGEGMAVQTYYRQLPPQVKLVFDSYRVPAAVGALP